jgi:biopolymer transport protein ExbD
MRNALYVLPVVVAAVTGCAGSEQPPVCPGQDHAASSTPGASQRATPIDLGPADNAVVLAVFIARGGAITVDGMTMSRDEDVRTRAAQVARGSPNVRGVISADETVAFARVTQAMELLVQGGVKRIAFATQPLSKPVLVTPATTGPIAPKVLPKTTPAAVRANETWDCVFPADASSVEVAVVVVRVMVQPDGKPESVEVVGDPGRGFADAARVCAMRHTYDPAREDGKPIRGLTTPFNIRFAK